LRSNGQNHGVSEGDIDRLPDQFRRPIKDVQFYDFVKRGIGDELSIGEAVAIDVEEYPVFIASLCILSHTLIGKVSPYEVSAVGGSDKQQKKKARETKSGNDLAAIHDWVDFIFIALFCLVFLQ
jgi:hypothetical protein